MQYGYGVLVRIVVPDRKRYKDIRIAYVHGIGKVISVLVSMLACS